MNNKKIPIILSIIALFISILFPSINLFITCNQNKKIDQLETFKLANDYRPMLNVFGHPYMDSIIININKIHFTVGDSIHGGDISGPTTLYCDLATINRGKSSCRFFAFVAIDTTSGEETIRDILSDKKLRENKIKVFKQNSYFTTQEIKINDTIHFCFSRTIQNIRDSSFTLHCLILYTGENGILYDTYYWAVYKIKEFNIPIKDETIGKAKQFEYLRFAVKNPRSILFDFEIDNQDSKIYSDDETTDLINFMYSKNNNQK